MKRMSVEIAVIGAGAVGTAIAYHLTRAGLPVLVVEQFALGHDRGSSHGAARITRHSYADRAYAELMPAAFAAWRELEADAATTLYVRTGAVSFSPPGVDYTERVAANLAALGVPFARLDGARWNARHELFSLPADYDVVFEPDAGMILAGRALESMRRLAEERGARFVSETAVERIEPRGKGLEVICRRRGEIENGDALAIDAGQVVVAAGGWVGELVPGLAPHLTPTLQHVFYLRPLDAGRSSVGCLPAFIYIGSDDDRFYGMPDVLGCGVKAARDGGPPLNPSKPERAADPTDRERLFDFLLKHMAGLAEREVIGEELCVYTMQRDHRFVVGPVPDLPSAWVASPCSGHGFKFSCLVGQVVAGLVTGRCARPMGWVEPAALSSGSEA